MHIEFVKAVQFSLLIKTGDRLREFNFRKLRNPEAEKFSVNVCNDRGDRVLFDMVRVKDDWELAPANLPQWIVTNKPRIAAAVEDELKNWA